MSERTEVRVESLRVSLTNQYRLILLKETNGALSLPVFVGQFEAEAIVLALQGIEISRPQTHDLILNMVKALGGRMRFVEITEMKASTFYAEIAVENESGEMVFLDCRPSDAIAAAVRAHVPIYVDSLTMSRYGIQPEPDVRRSKKAQADSQDQEEDLSAFEDFLGNF